MCRRHHYYPFRLFIHDIHFIIYMEINKHHRTFVCEQRKRPYMGTEKTDEKEKLYIPYENIKVCRCQSEVSLLCKEIHKAASLSHEIM
jgi:hypothetical protein